MRNKSRLIPIVQEMELTDIHDLLGEQTTPDSKIRDLSRKHIESPEQMSPGKEF
jgi:hypothetical protein